MNENVKYWSILMLRIAVLVLALFGIYAACVQSSDPIIVQPQQPAEYHCTKLVVHGSSGETITLGSNRSGTFIALSANRGSLGANFAFYVDGNGVPMLQLVDEYNRYATIKVSDYLTQMRRSNQGTIRELTRDNVGQVGALVP